jgi:hypothetical protein
MTKSFHRTLFLDGPAGRLEALLWTPPQDAGALAALVCHPHPLFGGTMHNKVVYQAAKTLHRLHLPVLRFNFRGAGLSQGQHDEGRGERDDVRAALDFLAREYAGRPLLLAGFSFGASVGLRAGCADQRVVALVGLGLPVNNTGMDFLRNCAKPKLFLQGGQDEFGSRANIESLVATLPEPKRLVVVEGADHFFTGKLNEVDAALRAWLLERFLQLGG